jgi:hypothetical protein
LRHSSMGFMGIGSQFVIINTWYLSNWDRMVSVFFNAFEYTFIQLWYLPDFEHMVWCFFIHSIMDFMGMGSQIVIINTWY